MHGDYLIYEPTCSGWISPSKVEVYSQSSVACNTRHLPEIINGDVASTQSVLEGFRVAVDELLA